jgi:hypothetical protein
MQAQLPSTVSDLEIRDEFATIKVTSKYSQVAKLLALNQSKVILAIDGKMKEVIGVITENFFLQKCATGIDPDKTKVEDCLQTNILRLLDDTPIDVVLRLVEETNPDAVIVMDSSRKFRGYLSPEDYRNLKLQNSNDSIPQMRLKSAAIIQPTPPKILTRIENKGTPQLKRGESFTSSELKQLIELAQHFCSNGGRIKQFGTRRGKPLNRLICIGNNDSYGINGIWAVDENQLLEYANTKLNKDLFCITVIGNSSHISNDWISGVEILSQFGSDVEINCIAVGKSSPIGVPSGDVLEKVTIKKSRSKKIDSSKFEKGALELVVKYEAGVVSSNDELLLCATIRNN